MCLVILYKGYVNLVRSAIMGSLISSLCFYNMFDGFTRDIRICLMGLQETCIFSCFRIIKFSEYI